MRIRGKGRAGGSSRRADQRTVCTEARHAGGRRGCVPTDRRRSRHLPTDGTAGRVKWLGASATVARDFGARHCTALSSPTEHGASPAGPIRGVRSRRPGLDGHRSWIRPPPSSAPVRRSRRTLPGMPAVQPMARGGWDARSTLRAHSGNGWELIARIGLALSDDRLRRKYRPDAPAYGHAAAPVASPSLGRPTALAHRGVIFGVDGPDVRRSERPFC